MPCEMIYILTYIPSGQSPSPVLKTTIVFVGWTRLTELLLLIFSFEISFLVPLEAIFITQQNHASCTQIHQAKPSLV